MDHDPGRSIDDLLSRLLSVLSGGAAADAEPTTGRSQDELVEATLGSDGLVDAITADPRVMRGGAGELADRIRAAVNEAVDARPRSTGATRPMSERLRELQEESQQQMQRMATDLVDAVKRIQG